MKEQFRLTGANKANEVLAQYQSYKIFWRSGYAFRGAREVEIVKSEFPKMSVIGNPKGGLYPPIHKVATFEEYMQGHYNWAAAIDIDVDHDKHEIHMNGFSENDLY